MDSGLLASLDWGALALVAVVAAALAWGMVFFLRQNRKDLDDLQQTLIGRARKTMMRMKKCPATERAIAVIWGADAPARHQPRPPPGAGSPSVWRACSS